MILPQTYTGALLLMILSLLCLGSWASLFKAGGKWRFELFYLDFAVGLAGAAVIAAFTFGNLGFDGLSVVDDMAHAGKHQWMYAFLAGVVFNLGNMLLTAAVAVAGMGVAFPAGMGVALVVGVLIGVSGGASLDSTRLGLGLAAMFLAIVLDFIAYRSVIAARRAALLAENRKRAAQATGAAKGFVLAVIGGLLIGGMYFLLVRATPPDVGLGPYSLALLFAFGVFVSTFVYQIFFLNLPVAGEPLEIMDYLKQRFTLHLLGFFAGVVWCAGMLANWLAGNVPAEAQLKRPAAFALSQGSLLLAAVWGLAVWRDFRQASGAGKTAAVLMLLLLGGAVALLSLAVSSAVKA